MYSFIAHYPNNKAELVHFYSINLYLGKEIYIGSCLSRPGYYKVVEMLEDKSEVWLEYPNQWGV